MTEYGMPSGPGEESLHESSVTSSSSAVIGFMISSSSSSEIVSKRLKKVSSLSEFSILSKSS